MPISEPISLVPYDPAWPNIYEAEASHICGAAQGIVEHIEHFGSTSIPGLISKPTIDIMASVPDIAAIQDFATWLGDDGYEDMSENFSFRRFFRKSAAGAGLSFHLHLVNEAAWATKSERLFREWLVAHPAVAASYAALKTKLASSYAQDRMAYTDAKSAFISKIVNEARAIRGLEPLTDWRE